MYHTRAKGTHYAAGFGYGRRLKEHGVVIQGSPTFAITAEMERFAADCLPVYRQYYPEIVQEMQGMADGQGTSLELLSQIVFSIYCFKPEQHCTCFAFANDKEILFGRNSDFLVCLEKLYMNCLYTLKDAYAFSGNTTAFIQMEDGMNERGLAVGLTFLYPHVRKPGLNAGMLVRYLLEKCATTEEAVAALHQLPIASSQTLTIADAGGQLAVVECNPEQIVVIEPGVDGFVASTNHFHSEPLLRFNAPSEIDDWRSQERYVTVQTALAQQAANGTLDFAERLLAGEYGFLCQYDRKTGADTVWSVVYDVKHGKVYRVEGNPSRKRFVEDTRMKFAPL